MKKYFVLVCKNPNGVIYPSGVLYSSVDFQDAIIRQSELGVKVIDVKVIDFNISDYE